MNEEHPKLLEKEKTTIFKYFPSFRPVWDKIVGKVPAKVKDDELYTYYAYVCMRDFADRYQTSGQMFFKALEEFTLQRRLNLTQEPQIASVFYFRRYFDYALLCLFSAINDILSSYAYLYGKKNIVEDRTQTIGGILNSLEKHKNHQFPSQLIEFTKNYGNGEKYRYIEKYRHDWTHRGTPKIEGEYRPKRNNPLETHGFSKNILGLVQHNGGYAMVAWSDEADYSIHKLVSCASWLYRKMGEEAILHFEQVEKTLNYNLSIQDFFGRKDRPE